MWKFQRVSRLRGETPPYLPYKEVVINNVLKSSNRFCEFGLTDKRAIIRVLYLWFTRNVVNSFCRPLDRP